MNINLDKVRKITFDAEKEIEKSKDKFEKDFELLVRRHEESEKKWAEDTIQGLQKLIEKEAQTGSHYLVIKIGRAVKFPKEYFFKSGFKPKCFSKHARQIYDYCKSNGLNPVIKRDFSFNGNGLGGPMWDEVPYIITIRW
jgi:hypothetical protein